MKKILALLFIFAALPVMANDSGGLSAQDSLERLKQGNVRFVEMRMKHPDATKKHRTELVNGQHPFAVILSCSDSRVPPELIFDQGLGDIFEVRNAGNVLNKHVIGSIEYAVMHLGVKLVIIMGHQNCGAVAAALSDETESAYIESLKASIMPAVEACKKSGHYTNNEVSKAHVIQDIQELLSEDSALKEYMQKHDVQIIPAFYHMDSGQVEFLR
jgi:carbonic anhydrase